jgi:uncharacterized protein YjbJ (UPF0337 family)
MSPLDMDSKPAHQRAFFSPAVWLICVFGFAQVRVLLMVERGGVRRPTQPTRRFTMNKDQVKGTAEKVKGKANEAVGKMTGDTTQQVKGQVQQGAGEARKQFGDAKEEIKKDNQR